MVQIIFKLTKMYWRLWFRCIIAMYTTIKYFLISKPNWAYLTPFQSTIPDRFWTKLFSSPYQKNLDICIVYSSKNLWGRSEIGILWKQYVRMLYLLPTPFWSSAFGEGSCLSMKYSHWKLPGLALPICPEKYLNKFITLWSPQTFWILSSFIRNCGSTCWTGDEWWRTYVFVQSSKLYYTWG